MNATNKDNGFTFTGPLAIIMGVIIFFFIIYFVLGINPGNDTSISEDVEVGRVITPSNVNDSENKSGYIEIPSLNLRLQDPNRRNLMVELINPVDIDNTTEKAGLYIKDSNSEFFGRCKYPVSINEINSPVGYDSVFTKKLNDKYYFVGYGTNEPTQCRNFKDSDSEYIETFRKYVIANLFVK